MAELTLTAMMPNRRSTRRLLPGSPSVKSAGDLGRSMTAFYCGLNRSTQWRSSRSQCLQLADIVSDELGGTGYAIAIAALFDELVAYGIEAIQ